MKIFEDYIVSDSGHTCIFLLKGQDKTSEKCVLQHSIAKQCLSDEDNRMVKEPEEVWKEYKGV